LQATLVFKYAKGDNKTDYIIFSFADEQIDEIKRFIELCKEYM